MSQPPYIAVIGPGQAEPPAEAVAEAVGALVARRGGVVVTGGLGGVMAAACRGARRAGGLAVGLLPGTDRADANPHCTVALPTGIGEARNALVVRAADAVIAVSGGYGTLSEIGLALKMGLPVFGLDTWELDPWRLPGPGIRACRTPEEAVDLAFAAARR